jgi:hypothetical protein
MSRTQQMAKKRRSRSERDGLRVKLVTQIVDNWSLCKDFKLRAYPLCLCIRFCQHLSSLLGLSTDFLSKIEVVSSSDPGLCEPSSHLSSSIALLSSPTYHFPHPLEVPLNHRFLVVAAPLIFTQRRTESRTSILASSCITILLRPEPGTTIYTSKFLTYRSRRAHHCNLHSAKEQGSTQITMAHPVET